MGQTDMTHATHDESAGHATESPAGAQPIRATRADVGCLVDGWYGQYGGAVMIAYVAYSYGYGYGAEDTASARADMALARRHLDAMTSRSAPGLSDDEYERLSGAVDDAESWLNERAAEDGHSFGWHDGEFFYQPTEWWEDA